MLSNSAIFSQNIFDAPKILTPNQSFYSQAIDYALSLFKDEYI